MQLRPNIKQESKTPSFEEFCKVAAEKLKLDSAQLHPEASWVKDVGISSVDIVKIAMLVRQKFGVKVPVSRLGRVKTVGETYNLLQVEKQ